MFTAGRGTGLGVAGACGSDGGIERVSYDESPSGAIDKAALMILFTG